MKKSMKVQSKVVWVGDPEYAVDELEKPDDPLYGEVYELNTEAGKILCALTEETGAEYTGEYWYIDTEIFTPIKFSVESGLIGVMEIPEDQTGPKTGDGWGAKFLLDTHTVSIERSEVEEDGMFTFYDGDRIFLKIDTTNRPGVVIYH